MMAQMPAARATCPPKASARITKSAINLGNVSCQSRPLCWRARTVPPAKAGLGCFTAMSSPTSSNANARSMDDNDLCTTSALPAFSQAPCQQLQRLPGATQQMSVFRLLGACDFKGAVQEFLIRPTPIAHAATPKTPSACGFELWADRPSLATEAANQLRYDLQRSLISGSVQCVASRCATPTRPPYHFGDHAFETRFTTTTDQFCRRLAFSTLKTVASHSDRHAICRPN
jgi:hypothetical protein